MSVASPSNQLTLAAGNSVGVGLISESHAALSTLDSLQKHAGRLDQNVLNSARAAAQDCRDRLLRRHIHVCVIGEQKAGKSTFLNAILGAPVLGSAVRECTSTVTYIRRSDRFDYTAKLVKGGVESFEVLHPDPTTAFNAAHKQLLAKIDECARNLENFPTEVERLRTFIPEQEAALKRLATQRLELEQAEAAAREAYTATHHATQAFEVELKNEETKVPFPYRNVGDWKTPWNSGGRLITQNFEKPEWKSHFDQVLKLHQDKQKAATLNEAHNAAIAATDAVRTAVYVQLSRIEENKARLAVITAYIADGPALAEKLNREKDELVTAHEQAMAARHAEFVSHVRSFTDMQKRGGEVDELTITYPSTLLPEDVIIIDTPGVNTTTEANRKKAWEAINNYSDACIVVSDTQQAMSASTRDFVSQVSQVVPHLMLVLTKIDRALENAGDDEDAEAQVAESIELGCAGFAQSMGRSAMHILAFAVASKPALDKKTPQAVERFASELKRLFAAIAAERSIAVGSRCARTLQNVLEKSAGVVEATENEGRRRLAQLEAQSITDPKDFCTARLQEVNGRLNQEAAEAARIMSLSTTTHLRRYKNELLELVIACDNPKELVAAAEEIEEESSSCIDRIIRRSRDETDSAMGGRLSALIEEVRIVLRKRYQIGQSISHATPRDMPMRPLSAGASLQLEEIGGLMKEKVNAFVSKQNSVKMGGIMAGPLFLANPLLGVAALGITLLRSANAPSFDSVRSQCAEAVAAIVDEAIDSAQTETRPDRVAAYFAEELKKILLADVKEFKGWINDVIAAERKELNRVRTEMADFTSVRSKLTSHNNRLSQLLTTAFAESSGLSRRNPQPTSP